MAQAEKLPAKHRPCYLVIMGFPEGARALATLCCVAAALTLLAACSSTDHPAFIAPLPAGGRGHVSPGVSEPTAGGGGATAIATGGTTSDPIGADGQFDPERVYLNTGLFDVPMAVIAPIENPREFAYGMAGGIARFRGNQLLYPATDKTTRVFVPDPWTDPPPMDHDDYLKTLANDPIVDTPRCPNEVNFFTGPGNRLIYQCATGQPWFEGEKLFHDGPEAFVALDDAGSALVQTGFRVSTDSHDEFGVLRLADSEVTPPILIDYEMDAARRNPKGFHVLAHLEGGQPELLEVSLTGQVKNLAKFALPTGFIGQAFALTLTDAVYCVGVKGAGVKTFQVIQLFSNGTSKTISTYDGDAATDLEHAVLLTGP